MDKELLQIVEQSNKTDLTALITAKENAKKAMLEDPSQTNIAAFERARRALDAITADPTATEPAFKNRAAVLKHLQQAGYKLGRQKLYNDVKAGLLRMRADGTVAESAVETYVNNPMARIVAPETIEDPEEAAALSNLQRQIKEAELDRIKEDTAGKRRKNRVESGHLIPRESLEMEVIARALALKAFYMQQFRSNVLEMIQSVGGRPAQAENLLSLLGSIAEEATGRYADLTRFQTIILPEKMEEA